MTIKEQTFFPTLDDLCEARQIAFSAYDQVICDMENIFSVYKASPTDANLQALYAACVKHRATADAYTAAIYAYDERLSQCVLTTNDYRSDGTSDRLPPDSIGDSNVKD